MASTKTRNLSYLLSFLFLAGIASILMTTQSAMSQGMGGMMMGGGMREMMHRMMPDLLPPGIKPEDLPDPDSKGAKLLDRYCTQCHNLPSPAMHTATQWPAIMSRMMRRMERMSGMMNTEHPSPEEEKTMLDYLKANSLKAIHPRQLPSPESVGASLFKDTCSQCHPLPDPKLHTAEQWPDIVKKMQAYMETMGKKVITDKEANKIANYLAAHAGTKDMH